MNTFIKNNWFKLVITIGIILICLSVNYYFVVYLPNRDNIKQDLNNQIKCQEAGNKLYQSQIKEAEGSGNYAFPEFKFNKELKTCLYKNIYLGGDNYMSNFIIDVYTNKYIINWDREIGGKDILGSKEEWELKVAELFGE